MKRISAVFACCALLLGTIGVSAAEEEKTWGQVKELSGEAVDELEPAAKLTISGRRAGGWAPAQVMQFEDNQVVGKARLKRRDNGVSLTIKTSGLVPGHTYSVWFIPFEFPELCAGTEGFNTLCNGDDLTSDLENPTPADGSSFGSVAGAVALPNGRAMFRMWIPAFEAFATDIPFGDGVLDHPLTAEIHVVVRTHGPAIPGMLDEQLDTLNAGCEAGEPNEGLCANLQFAIFKP